MEVNYMDKLIKEQDAVITMSWTPYTKESLPPEDGQYLITVDRFSSIVGDYIHNDVMIDDFYKGNFLIVSRPWAHEPIIKAWMPKPAPYTGD